ncbi:SDR family NAD(P)-dependent oxidoreductase [Vibrio sp. S4M6]|uniref:SDR family NAD(P)-dependent oxidoreductase n=1 Tax=Vibrio sinus TaxID=2946865 RepID=UPI00202A1D14|nr:SDR family NAD(P)-dependent oxidoreductase [Vibrio sinus]MCL9780955.1 SDR family NAD(P)-dependent oxidoreductase [Vibrio sinus]
MTKTAVVTGASKCIGKAMAQYLAHRGYNLILIARDGNAMHQLKGEILESYPSLQIDVHPLDLANCKVSIPKLQEIASSVSKVDVLFNNAGIAYPGTLDLDFEQFSEMMDLNVKGVFAVAKIFGEKMKQQRDGYIFNIASVAGKRSLSYLGGYCASKYAVVGFNSALRQELSPYNVKVTALCPGISDATMTKGINMISQDKLGSWEVIHAVEYLLNSGSNTVVETLDIELNLTLYPRINTSPSSPKYILDET